MNRIASLSSAFVLLAITAPQPSVASDGGGNEMLILPPKPACAHFVGAARTEVRTAEGQVKVLKKQRAAAARQKSAGARLVRAKLKLANVRAGKC